MIGPVHYIRRRVAAEYGVALDAIDGPRRERATAWPRMVAMYLAAELCRGATLLAIAAMFNRDHTSVMHARRVVPRRLARDERERARVARLKRELKAGVKRASAALAVERQAHELVRALVECAHEGLIRMARRDPEAFVRRFL